MTQDNADILKAILSFISSLVWPFTIIWFVLSFRSQVVNLINRLASVKVAGNEFVFQQPPNKSLPLEVIPKSNIEIGPDGFLTVPSLRAIVMGPNLTGDDETIVGELMIFQTPRQRTWIISTTKQFFIILDDETTRQQRNLIQTLFERNRALPLEFSLNVVRFAAEDTWWYYSQNLFPTSDRLTDAVRRLCQMHPSEVR